MVDIILSSSTLLHAEVLLPPKLPAVLRFSGSSMMVADALVSVRVHCLNGIPVGVREDKSKSKLSARLIKIQFEH